MPNHCHFGRYFGYNHDDRPDERSVATLRCSFSVVSDHLKPNARNILKLNTSTARICYAVVFHKKLQWIVTDDFSERDHLHDAP